MFPNRMRGGGRFDGADVARGEFSPGAFRLQPHRGGQNHCTRREQVLALASRWPEMTSTGGIARPKGSVWVSVQQLGQVNNNRGHGAGQHHCHLCHLDGFRTAVWAACMGFNFYNLEDPELKDRKFPFVYIDKSESVRVLTIWAW